MPILPLFAAMAFFAAVPQQVPEARLVRDPIFDSGADESKPYHSIGRLDGAMMLAPNRLAIADGARQAVYLMNVVDGSFSVVRGDTFDSAADIAPTIQLVDRLPGGFLVIGTSWLGSNVILSANGDVVGSIADEGSLLAHVLPGRTPIVRRTSPPIGFQSGDVRATAADHADFMRLTTGYVAISEAGASVTIAEAPGAEQAMVRLTFGGRAWGRTQRVIFGNTLLTARSGAHLLIAPTDSDSIRVYNREGDATSAIPMPGTSVEVSPEQVRAQRRRRMEEQEIGSLASRRTGLLSTAMAAMAGGAFTLPPDSLLLSRVPASNRAPAIDRMLANDSGQVWIRLFPMPDEATTRWIVWNMERSVFDFSVTLPRHERLLDVAFGFLLLATQDANGGDRLLVKTLQPQC